MNNVTDNSSIFSMELLEVFQDKKSKKAIQRLLEKNYNDKAVYLDCECDEPIVSNKRLYAFLGLFEKKFFDSEKELLEYLGCLDIIYGEVFIINHLGERYGFKDTISLTCRSGKVMFYSFISENICAKYDYVESVLSNEHVWKLVAGGMNSVYKAFTDREIDVKYDIFNIEDEICELTGEQKFDVLTVSCNRSFEVDIDKSNEFLNVKPDLKVINERNKLLKRVKINNEV